MTPFFGFGLTTNILPKGKSVFFVVLHIYLQKLSLFKKHYAVIIQSIITKIAITKIELIFLSRLGLFLTINIEWEWRNEKRVIK